VSRIDYLTGQLSAMTGADREAVHVCADAVLVEAVRELQRMPEYYTNEEVERLIAAYEAVPKWYA